MAQHLLTQAQHGGALHAAVGDDVLLRLPENPTTGYRWEFSLPAGLSQAADDFAAAGGAPGGGGERVVRLQATAPGRHTVTAALRRSWDAGGPPQASFSATIEVT
jgi:inhibitor of cysteine peptidase